MCAPIRCPRLPDAGADAGADAGGSAGSGEGVGDVREVLYVNTGGHEGLEGQMLRYQRAGHLRKWRWQGSRPLAKGQWGVEEVLSEAKRIARITAGLVHTRDAGL